MCRAGSLKIPGFPQFETVVSDLKKNNAELPVPEYEVRVAVPNGCAIKQNLVDYWLASEHYQAEMAEVLKDHNAKWNPHGVKRGADASEQPAGASSLF